MDHRDIQERLAAFHDGELPESERAAVLLHIGSCVGCRDDLAEMEGIAALLRAPAAPAANPLQTDAFVRRVMAVIGAEKNAGRSQLKAWLPFITFRNHALSWDLTPSRWLIPALAFGLAALWVSIAAPFADANLPLDSLVLADGGGRGFAELAGLRPPAVSYDLPEALGANP